MVNLMNKPEGKSNIKDIKKQVRKNISYTRNKRFKRGINSVHTKPIFNHRNYVKSISLDQSLSKFSRLKEKEHDQIKFTQ